MTDFQLPKADEHTSIIGRTGSGKTQQGAWLLSQADLHRRPHVIIDYKGDDLLNEIDGVRELSLKDTAKKPGLYIVHIMPGDDDEVENFLWNIWKQENTGLYIDEGYMIDKYSRAFNSLLTQGRSKKVSVTCLTQRPTACSRFIFSEASHISLFHLNDVRDYKTVQGFAPVNIEDQLPEFHAHWYNVKKNKKYLLRPVPDRDTILSYFADKLKVKRSFL